MNDTIGISSHGLNPDELDTNLGEFGLLNFLNTEKGKKYLKYRFFREPYWLGYLSILTTTFVALLIIGLSSTPLSFLSTPIVLFFFFTQIYGIYKFIKGRGCELCSVPDELEIWSYCCKDLYW